MNRELIPLEEVLHVNSSQKISNENGWELWRWKWNANLQLAFELSKFYFHCWERASINLISNSFNFYISKKSETKRTIISSHRTSATARSWHPLIIQTLGHLSSPVDNMWKAACILSFYILCSSNDYSSCDFCDFFVKQQKPKDLRWFYHPVYLLNVSGKSFK